MRWVSTVFRCQKCVRGGRRAPVLAWLGVKKGGPSHERVYVRTGLRSPRHLAEDQVARRALPDGRERAEYVEEIASLLRFEKVYVKSKYGRRHMNPDGSLPIGLAPAARSQFDALAGEDRDRHLIVCPMCSRSVQVTAAQLRRQAEKEGSEVYI